MALPVPAAAYARRSLVPDTLKVYRSAWDDFIAWCRVKSISPLPATPDAVANYHKWTVAEPLIPMTLSLMTCLHV